MTDRAEQGLSTPVSRFLPIDLLIICGVILLTLVAVFIPEINNTPVRKIIAYPFVLFVPGYALLAALFPARDREKRENGEHVEATQDLNEKATIDGIERLAFSFGLSLVLLPPLGLLLNFTPWGIQLSSMVVSLSLFSLLGLGVAAIRRSQLPENERFVVPLTKWVAEFNPRSEDSTSTTDSILSLFLVFVLLFSIGSAGYVLAAQPAESSTEYSLLHKSNTGKLVADHLPRNLSEGKPATYFVQIQNHEHHPVSYTVVVKLQKVRVGNNTTQVQSENELHRFHAKLADNESWVHKHTITPNLQGKRIRLVYLFYKGTPPQNPTLKNADSELHLWVTVNGQKSSS